MTQTLGPWLENGSTTLASILIEHLGKMEDKGKRAMALDSGKE